MNESEHATARNNVALRALVLAVILVSVLMAAGAILHHDQGVQHPATPTGIEHS